jgi:hypothetical protein
MRSRLFPTLLLALLTFGSNAWATPTFPGVLQAELGLESRPPCSTCHVDGATRSGNMTPFARSLMSRGLRPENEASLRTAIQALQGEGKDSDGDGAGDIEELVAGTDPNLADGGEGQPAELGTEVPSYGCSLGQPSRDTGGAPSAALRGLTLLLGLGLVACLRRRPRA